MYHMISCRIMCNLHFYLKNIEYIVIPYVIPIFFAKNMLNFSLILGLRPLRPGQGAACPEDLEDQKEGCNSEDCPVDSRRFSRGFHGEWCEDHSYVAMSESCRCCKPVRWANFLDSETCLSLLFQLINRQSRHLQEAGKQYKNMKQICFRLISLYWLVVWNMNFIFPLILGMSSSQLTNSIIFQMGGSTTNQCISPRIVAGQTGRPGMVAASPVVAGTKHAHEAQLQKMQKIWSTFPWITGLV